MLSLAHHFPLPFTCLHSAYTAGVEDDYGNAIPGWADPVARPCIWWSQTSSKEFGDEPAANEQAAMDLNLIIDSAVTVDQRDRFTIEGKPFEVVGLPKDFDHGPWARPDRRLIELKWVG